MRPRKRASKKQLKIFVQDEQLVGGYIPRQLSEELSLLAVYSNTSRSEIIRSLITERLGNEDMTHIINALADRIFKSWQQHCIERKDAALNFTQYRFHTRRELETKKINPAYVQRIMSRAQELHEAYKAEQFKRTSQATRFSPSRS